MPTYQYRCTQCATELEAVQRFTDDPLTVCPECEGSLRKVFSAVGVVFKGSGFYATDSRSQGKTNAARPAESTTSTSTTSTEKSESAAPAAKTESTSSTPSSTASSASTPAA